MTTLKEFERKFLPEAIESGSFGKNIEVLSVVRDGKEGEDQFASSVMFVLVTLKVDGEVNVFPLVCKFQSDNEEIREKFSTDLQFFNEVLVYKNILPLFKQNMLTCLPKYYFGKATLNKSHEDDVIMIEDLTPKGFRLSFERIFLDVEHCLLALRKLGEFHGASLVVKTQDPQHFKTSVGQLVETRWLDSKKEYLNYFLGENAKRGVLPLLDVGEDSEILTRFLDQLNDIYEMMGNILLVNEMSVLCHGDFCRNNMMFKYESGSTSPVDVMFFDPATARHASPVVDISFFLFLNTTVEVRRNHFKKDFLKAYLQGVKETAGENAPKEEDLWKEFQAKAVYGYVIAAFFLPIMFNNQTANPDPTESLEESVKRVSQYGGENVTTMLKESVQDLITWGCLK